MMRWTKIASEPIHDGYVSLRRDRYRMPDGRESDFEVARFGTGAAAIVLALTPGSRIIVAEQYRWGPERVFYDLPAGGIDENEDPLDAAKRELLEETGYASDDWAALGSAHVLAQTPFVKHFFLARNCVKREAQKLDAGEFIEVRLLTRDAFEGVVEDALLCDSEVWFRALAKGLID